MSANPNRMHPVVVTTVNKALATAQLRAEQLRSKRNALSTVSTGQQNRAIELGKALREADAIAESWRQALVAMSSAVAQASVGFDRLTVAVREAGDATARKASETDG